MHINMKYYVVSIGAIFIALGIGMLVGFNLNYDQELSKQQATIIEDLDKKFENLKTKNDELETALDSSEKNNYCFVRRYQLWNIQKEKDGSF